MRTFRRTLRQGCERGEFRVVHDSIQRDHGHFLVEATGKQALSRGMKSLAARFARAANRTFGRTGPVLDGRYHARILRTPREVRNALAYVLLNARRHWHKRRGAAPHVRLDEASSGRWFDGWKRGAFGGRGPPVDEREISRPHTWLLATGWRRHGLVGPAEAPGVKGAGGGRPLAPRGVVDEDGGERRQAQRPTSQPTNGEGKSLGAFR